MVDRCTRVNLISGQNNVGKTTLLEALAVYARSGLPQDIANLLDARDEGHHRGLTGAVDGLFNDARPNPRITFSQADGGAGLTLRRGYAVRNRDTAGRWRTSDEPDPVDDSQRVVIVERAGFKKFFRANLKGMRESELPWEQLCPCLMVFSEGLDLAEGAELWRNTAGFELEDDLVEALRLIEPDVQRIHFVEGSEADEDDGSRPWYCRLRLAGEATPVPLRRYGDGMSRLLGIALALVNCANGILLVDEFENGLHYSVHAKVWRFLFALSRRLNVQVFATTHSWDCITAFQQVSDEFSGEAQLIRLARLPSGSVAARIFSDDDLRIVTQQAIEVR